MTSRIARFLNADIFRRINKSFGRLTNIQLGQTALVVFFAGALGMNLLKRRLQWRLGKMEHFKEAMALLDDHEQAKDLLGDQIFYGRVVIRDWMHRGRTQSQLRIPVCGDYAGDLLHVLALRESPAVDHFTVEHLELSMDMTGECILIYDRQLALKEEAERRARELEEEEAERKSKQRRPRLNRGQMKHEEDHDQSIR